jgi:hypothetical protein
MHLLQSHREVANPRVAHIFFTARPGGTHGEEATSDEDVIGVRLQRRDAQVVGIGATKGTTVFGTPTTRELNGAQKLSHLSLHLRRKSPVTLSKKGVPLGQSGSGGSNY